MTEHPHMPRILRTTANRLVAGKIIVTIRGAERVIPWEEAMELAKDITEVLQLEVRP